MKANIEFISQGKWRLNVVVKRNGKQHRIRRIFYGTLRQAELKYWEIRRNLSDKADEAERSLTNSAVDFLYVLEGYVAEGTEGISAHYIEVLKRELGHCSMEELGVRFSNWYHALKATTSPITKRKRSGATMNRYRHWARAACNYAVKKGLIEKNPIPFIRREDEEARDRVLSDDEATRFLAVLKQENSYLYWPVRFALRNPIRSGDLFSLEKKNLDMMKPWIHFYPRKTKRRKPRETCLVCLEPEVMSYFASLPADCPLLFPAMDDRGRWTKVPQNYYTHLRTMLKLAKIDDFVIHDLKHCSLTWMLDNGFTERDLKNLGIQYNPAMIDRYYHADAAKALRKWNASSGSSLQEAAPASSAA